MSFFKKYKLLIIVLALFTIGTSIFYFTRKGEKSSNNIEMEVKDLPFKVDSTPLTFNIVEENGQKVLQVSYKNDSEETIYNLRLELKLKDTGEVIQVGFNEVVEPGNSSTVINSKAPESASTDDVEVLKYKISLRSGTYMEYDAELNQYNWS